MSPKPWKGRKVVSVIVVLALTALAVAGLLAESRSGSHGSLVSPERDCDSLSHFESPEALASFLAPRTDAPEPWLYRFGLGTTVLTGPGSGPQTGTTAFGTTSFSGTNNQVAGVDEADITKTDGQRIYTVSQGGVVVLDAVPPADARVLSRIPTDGQVAGLLVDGERLVVLEAGSYSSGHTYYAGYTYYPAPTRVLVYDLADPSAPALVRSVSVSGGYVGSRLIGDYAYVVATEYAYMYDQNVSLPTITTDGARRTLAAQEIGYFKDSEGGSIATVLAVHVTGDEAPAYEAFVTRSASQIYVSAGNVYIAGAEYDGGDSWSAPSETSTIHRIAIDGGTVRYSCSVRVPGTILNQFSMDEYEGTFRVATTVGHVGVGQSDARNNVYVVDGAFSPLGKLEGLAPGERIYSARFMGDRAYLVTFKKIDPLFVIDLTDPAAPRVLGYLKVPGYSDYLHPYDATHVIGIGKDAHDMGDFAWYQGLKVSLFDVADVEHPTELATYGIGDRGTASDVLQDHKAFLFIPERSLVVLPVQLYEIDRSQYPGEVPPETYGEFVWQGAYVLSVTLDGISLKGRVTHGMDPDSYGSGEHAIHRSLYIGDVLYTVSPAMVRMNALDDLADLGGVAL